ncbi:MAG TPA: MdtA/MuxA family multidrug efflux RND transporter periplasmic adaptor subunit [Candidatus Binataceae bacterium]|nr:MdtA/MuxA family multidrug efflux RND transporter periplasmic adaptor subunit [Candidatus Binataceae bacterium]
MIVLVIAYFWRAHRQAVEAAAAQKNARPMIPVSAVQAQLGDLDLYLTAIGSVTPFNTTTVKSRVDGAIQNIFYTEGETVKAGDLLIQIDPRPYQVQLTQAQGQMAKDQAAYEVAKITFERDQLLYSQGVIARQDLDNQQSTMDQAKGAVESDRGAIDNAKLNITYSRISAPISGRIGLRLLDLGNIVHATDTTGLAVITQLQPIAVIFALPEDDIPRVVKRTQSGQPLTVQAWDRDFTKQLSSGTLMTFDNQIDQTTGTVKLKAQFDNPDYALFPSQFVNARLLINTIKSTVLIPTAAVQKSPQGNFVYVVKPDDSVMQRGVTVGATQGDISSIKNGVNQGDTVVTDGVDKLQPGTKVSVHLATFALIDHPTAQ